MTNREFYTAISANETLDTEVRAFADAAIAKMDTTNEKRKNTPSKTTKENAPLIDQMINEVISTTPKTAAEIAAEMDISVQKASALARQVVAAGKAVATEVKVPKKGTQKAYSAVEVEVVEA